jgi:hypothetical protein
LALWLGKLWRFPSVYARQGSGRSYHANAPATVSIDSILSSQPLRRESLQQQEPAVCSSSVAEVQGTAHRLSRRPRDTQKTSAPLNYRAGWIPRPPSRCLLHLAVDGMYTSTGLGGTQNANGQFINPQALSSSSKSCSTSINRLNSARRKNVLYATRSIIAILPCRRLVGETLLMLGIEVGLSNQSATITPDTSPRGIKRSHSPDIYGDLPPGDNLGEDGMYFYI